MRSRVNQLLRRTEEELLSLGTVDNIPIWYTEDFHDTCQLLMLVLTREDRYTGVQLG
jgi:hypothetical protein